MPKMLAFALSLGLLGMSSAAWVTASLSHQMQFAAQIPLVE
jgi:hypothetical protein